MKLRSIRRHPGRIAAAALTAGLVFAAGSVAGNALGSDGAHAAAAQTHTDTPAPSAAAADTLYHYLTTLSPADRAQTIIALNPNVRGALEAIVAGNVAAATTH